MKTLLILAALTLAGCASQQPPMSAAQQRDHDECVYEAEKATAAILNGFEAGFTKGRLTRQCMKLRGYK